MGNGTQRPRTADSVLKQKNHSRSQSQIIAERSESARKNRQQEQEEFSKIRENINKRSSQRKTAYSFGEIFEDLDITPIRAGGPKQQPVSGSLNSSKASGKQNSDTSIMNMSKSRQRIVPSEKKNPGTLNPLDIFTQEQVRKFKAIFDVIDEGKSGFISATDFRQMRDFKTHALRERIYEIIDLTLSESQNRMNFDTLLKILLIFHPTVDNERKYKFLFRIYDVDEDDIITLKDLEDIYHMIYLEHHQNQDILKDMFLYSMNEGTIKKMAKRLMDTLSPEKQNLNYDEFKWAVCEGDLRARMDIYY